MHRIRHTAHDQKCTSIGCRSSIIHKYSEIRVPSQIAHTKVFTFHAPPQDPIMPQYTQSQHASFRKKRFSTVSAHLSNHRPNRSTYANSTDISIYPRRSDIKAQKKGGPIARFAPHLKSCFYIISPLRTLRPQAAGRRCPAGLRRCPHRHSAVHPEPAGPAVPSRCPAMRPAMRCSIRR